MRSETGRAVVRVIAVLLSIVAVWLSFSLLQLHYRPAGATASAPASKHRETLADQVCTTVLPEADCAAAVKSYWGTIPKTDVPTAQLGLYYFTAVFWWFLLVGGVTYSRRGIHLLVAAIMALGLGVSLFLIYQIKLLPQPCGLCLLTHVINILLFICLLLLWPREPRVTAVVSTEGEPSPGGLFARERIAVEESHQTWPTGWALLVLPIIILLSFFLETPLRGQSDAAQAVIAQTQQKLEDERRSAESYRREAEMLRSATQGQDVTKELGALQDRLREVESAREESENDLHRQIALREKQLETMNAQIETLRKASEGKTEAKDTLEMQNKWRTAEAYKTYWEQQFRRYDNRWQLTHAAWAISPPVNIPVDKTPVKGPETAAHTIVVYSDFQCPTCKKFEDWFRDRIEPMGPRYGGIRIYFKYWPISTKCNSYAKTDLHPSACEAARAAQAAFAIGGNEAFWKMHDLLFANQDIWKDKPNFDAYATQLGLNLDQFHNLMQSEMTLARIKADIDEGAGLGKNLVNAGLIGKDEGDDILVNGTPSIFVDGKKLVSFQHQSTWRTIMANPVPPWQPERRSTSAPAQRVGQPGNAVAPASRPNS